MKILTNTLMAVMITSAFTATAYAGSKEVSLDEFSKIKTYASVDFDVQVGKATSLTLEGRDEDLENLIVKVVNDTLIIKKKNKSYQMKDVKATLTTKDLSAFHLYGSGDAVIRDVHNATFDLGVSGSGDITLNGKSDDLKISVSGSGDIVSKGYDTKSISISVSGSGDIEFAGKCQELDVGISGSGDFNGRDLTCATAEIRISGSGDVYVYASEAIHIKSSGSSDINVYGNPKSLENRSSGSSDLVMHKDK